MRHLQDTKALCIHQREVERNKHTNLAGRDVQQIKHDVDKRECLHSQALIAQPLRQWTEKRSTQRSRNRRRRSKETNPNHSVIEGSTDGLCSASVLQQYETAKRMNASIHACRHLAEILAIKQYDGRGNTTWEFGSLQCMQFGESIDHPHHTFPFCAVCLCLTCPCCCSCSSHGGNIVAFLCGCLSSPFRIVKKIAMARTNAHCNSSDTR